MTGDLGTIAYSLALGSWLSPSVFVNWRLVCSNPQEFLLPPPSFRHLCTQPSHRLKHWTTAVQSSGRFTFLHGSENRHYTTTPLGLPCRTKGSGKVPTSLFAVKQMRWQGFIYGKFFCTLESGCCGAGGPSDLNLASLPPEAWAVSTQAKSLVMGRSSRLSF